MDLTIVSVTNVGRRKCIAFFEDLSYKIEKKQFQTHRFSSRKFDTPVALRGPRNPNGEDLSREIAVFFASRAKIRISWQKFVTTVPLRGLRNSSKKMQKNIEFHRKSL